MEIEKVKLKEGTWSKQEKAKLIELFPDNLDDFLVKSFNRKLDSIQKKASYMNLKRTDRVNLIRKNLATEKRANSTKERKKDRRQEDRVASHSSILEFGNKLHPEKNYKSVLAIYDDYNTEGEKDGRAKFSKLFKNRK